MPETFVVPLESNPEVLNKYLSRLGVSEDYQIFDVYGLDDDYLNFIPQPVKALILLFPCTDVYEHDRKKKNLTGNTPAIPENLFYIRQFVRNSCGTMALIHSVLNNLKDVDLKDGSVMKNFYEKAKGLSPEERGKLLEQDETFIDVHRGLADEGQTAAPPLGELANYHYVALVNVADELFELDGSEYFPITHGATTDESFLLDSARVCQEFIARDPKEVNFSIMAFANAK